MQSTSWETLDWKKHKPESRLPGEISITSDIHPYGKKWRGNKKLLDENEIGEWKSRLKAQHSENEDHGIRSYHFMGSSVQFSSVQSLSRVRLFATSWIAARQASLSITISRSSLRLTSIESVMPSSHLIFTSCPQSLPASGSFPMSKLFAWGGQSTGASALASFLPKKSQGWSPSQWTSWISSQSKGLSRVFSNTTVQKHQFFGTQPSSQSNSHIYTWPLEKP